MHQQIEESVISNLRLNKVTLFCKCNNYDPVEVYYTLDFNYNAFKGFIKGIVQYYYEDKFISFKNDQQTCSNLVYLFYKLAYLSITVSLVDDNKRFFNLMELRNPDLIMSKLFIVIDDDLDLRYDLFNRASLYTYEYLSYSNMTKNNNSIKMFKKNSQCLDKSFISEYFDFEEQLNEMYTNHGNNNNNNNNNSTNDLNMKPAILSDRFPIVFNTVKREFIVSKELLKIPSVILYLEQTNKSIYIKEYSAFDPDLSINQDKRIYQLLTEKVFLPIHDLCTMNDQEDYYLPNKYTIIMPFALGTKPSLFEENMVPSPKYIPMELHNQLLKQKCHISEFEKWSKDSYNWLITPDVELVEANRNILPSVFKLIIKNNFSISGLNISVDTNDGMGMLMRLGNYFCTAPLYLNKAFKSSNNKDRFGFIATMFISCLNGNLMIRKPFIPYIGETVSSAFDYFDPDYNEYTHVDYFAEYVCHYPPTVNLYMENKGKWKIYGSVHFYITIGFNACASIFDGLLYIEFSDGQIYTYSSMPSLCFKSILWGEFKACLKNEDSVIKLDENNYMKISYGHDSWDVLKIQGDLYLKDLTTQISMKEPVKGEVLKELYIGKTHYYRYRKDDWCPLLYHLHCLPSDTRYREDIIYHIHGQFEYANWWNRFLTKSNRYDRKFRGDKI